MDVQEGTELTNFRIRAGGGGVKTTLSRNGSTGNVELSSHAAGMAQADAKLVLSVNLANRYLLLSINLAQNIKVVKGKAYNQGYASLAKADLGLQQSLSQEAPEPTYPLASYRPHQSTTQNTPEGQI